LNKKSFIFIFIFIFFYFLFANQCNSCCNVVQGVWLHLNCSESDEDELDNESDSDNDPVAELESAESLDADADDDVELDSTLGVIHLNSLTIFMGADGVGSKKLEKCFLWSGVLKRGEDGEINSTDGVGNSSIGFKSEGVGKNSGVDNTFTVASPFKSRMGEMGV
jgi:hypothetical protein